MWRRRGGDSQPPRNPPTASRDLRELAAILASCPRAGWISMLLLDWLTKAVQPPGSRTDVQLLGHPIDLVPERDCVQYPR